MITQSKYLPGTKYADFIPEAIREVVGENGKYVYSDGAVIAPNSHHAKVKVREIIKAAKKKYLEKNGNIYRVSMTFSCSVYAESEEEAVAAASDMFNIEDARISVEETENTEEKQ